MSGTGKKRTLQELIDDDEKGIIDEPPPKKAKLDHNDNGKKSILKESVIDLIDDKNITIDKLKKLFTINTSKFNNRYEVYQHFRNISLALIRDLVLIFPNNNKSKRDKLYEFVEFEFYCLDYGSHQDVFAHCDDLQFTTNASWYFHRSGNTSVEGYKFLNDDNLMSNPNKIHNKKWINPRPHVSFRNGTFKGLDITFGQKNQHFGGILIRSMRELKPLNTSFTTDTNTIYSPSDIIEGPCKCVDNLLKETDFKTIKELTNSKNFNLNIFGNDTNTMYVDLANKYNIKELSPQKVSNKNKNKNNDDDEDEDDDIKYDIKYEEYFYNSPRVGLTLKKEKNLSGKELEIFQNIKKEFVMAPYRSIRKNCLSKMKRYKALIALSMIYNKYYYNKLNNNNNNKQSDNNKYFERFYRDAITFGPFKQKGLDNLIKHCKNGQKENSKIIKEASNKFPTNTTDLSNLFGALM